VQLESISTGDPSVVTVNEITVVFVFTFFVVPLLLTAVAEFALPIVETAFGLICEHEVDCESKGLPHSGDRA